MSLLFRTQLILPLLICFGFSIHSAIGQKQTLAVFIQCSSCDMNFVRQELNFVDHVRDQALADVFIFINPISTGSGRTYEIQTEGQKEFAGETGELNFTTLITNTNEEIRKGLVKFIRLSLFPYLIKTELSEKMDLQVDRIALEEQPIMEEEDPWKNWIFEIRGSGGIDIETSRERFDYEIGFESDKVTEDWRVRFDAELFQSENVIDDDEETYISVRRRQYAYGSVVKSIDSHWSAGVFGGLTHDTYQNYKISASIRPAIEYNIFPYSEVLYREITVAYKIGAIFNDYIETTIFNQDDERLFQQSLEIAVRYRQKWGDLYSRLVSSSYLHDFSKYRIRLRSYLNVRLWKGLGLRVSTNLEFIRDQITLPSGDASLEDLLLRQRQIATGFETGANVGLSYTFGSAVNNIVNTRL